MKKSSLIKKGGFVKPDLIEFNETWTHVDKDAGDPKKNFIIEDDIKFFVKQASWLEFKESVDGKKTEQGNEKPLNNEALAVAACIRLEDEEKLSYEEVITLESSLYYIFRNAVYEIYSSKKN